MGECKEDYDQILNCEKCGCSLGHCGNYYGESKHICDNCYNALPHRPQEPAEET